MGGLATRLTKVVNLLEQAVDIYCTICIGSAGGTWTSCSNSFGGSGDQPEHPRAETGKDLPHLLLVTIYARPLRVY